MRRVMQAGDVIKVTVMPQPSFPEFKPPLYALAIERRPTADDPDYHKLLIVEGGYGRGKVAGEMFHLPGRPSNRRDLDWRIVPPQSVPDRIWVAIAKWRLIGGDSDNA